MDLEIQKMQKVRHCEKRSCLYMVGIFITNYNVIQEIFSTFMVFIIAHARGKNSNLLAERATNE